MKKKSLSSMGLHHGKAKRPARNRDGVKWPADGGAGVTPAMTKGYSETAGSGGKVKAKTKASKKAKADHASYKQ